MAGPRSLTRSLLLTLVAAVTAQSLSDPGGRLSDPQLDLSLLGQPPSSATGPVTSIVLDGAALPESHVHLQQFLGVYELQPDTWHHGRPVYVSVRPPSLVLHYYSNSSTNPEPLWLISYPHLFGESDALLMVEDNAERAERMLPPRSRLPTPPRRLLPPLLLPIPPP